MNARNLTRSALAAGLICVLVFFALSRPLEDFVAYWTAAHLFVAHKNPYSLIEVNQFQAPLGWKQPIPLMFLNPPWTLPLIAPVGFAKSYSLAWLAWVGMLATVLVVSSRLLLNLYSGDVAIPEISDTPLTRSLLLFSFYPVLLCLRFSQTSPLPLLGLAAFLWFESREQPIPAGISLGLLALKPHLVYLVLLAVILRCLQRGIWSIVASATAVVSLLTLLAVLVDHRVMREYWELSVGPYLQLQPSAMGAILRLPFAGHNTRWLQFAPSIAGLVWFVPYWRKHRQDWNWPERMPSLVTACMLTTTYGRLYDQALLAVPIVALFGRYAKTLGRIPRNAIWIYTAVNFALIIGAMRVSPFAFPVAPLTVGLFLHFASVESWRHAHSANAGLEAR